MPGLNRKIIRQAFMTVLFLFLVATDFLGADIKSQGISIGTARFLDSDILKENRDLLIYLPENYHETKKSYPVLYLLDGEWHFHHVSGILQFFQWSKKSFDIILVAVTNTHRGRDFSPTEWPGHSSYKGGAAKFNRFLKDELIPYIDKNFRTTSPRILCGHSLAGTFSLFSFLTEPEVFDAYISLSPCLFWYDRAMLRLAAEFLNNHRELEKCLYIAHEYGDGIARSTMIEFVEAMNRRAPKGLRWSALYKEGEDHYSYVHKAIYDGLDFIFK